MEYYFFLVEVFFFTGAFLAGAAFSATTFPFLAISFERDDFILAALLAWKICFLRPRSITENVFARSFSAGLLRNFLTASFTASLAFLLVLCLLASWRNFFLALIEIGIIYVVYL